MPETVRYFSVIWRWFLKHHDIVSSLCMLILLWFDDFSKLTFSKNCFKNTFRVSNYLDPVQDRHPVGPELGPNCLQRSLAEDKVAASKEELTYDLVHEILVLIAFARKPPLGSAVTQW